MEMLLHIMIIDDRYVRQSRFNDSDKQQTGFDLATRNVLLLENGSEKFKVPCNVQFTVYLCISYTNAVQRSLVFL